MSAVPLPTSGLAWAGRLLFEAGGAAVTWPGGTAPTGWPAVQSFLVLPRPSAPRLLVPLGSRAAAAAAVRRSDTGTRPAARVARTLLAAGLHAGLGRRLGHPLHVAVDPATPISERGAALLRDHLRDVLDRADLEVAVILGPPRLNRKPVLQLLDRRGAVVGYAKAAWNEITRGLVRNEALVLAGMAGSPPSTFTVPAVLHHGPWGGLDLLVVSALPPAAGARRGRTAQAPAEAIGEIARRAGVIEAPLTRSPYWAEVRRRATEPSATAVADDGAGPLRSIVGRIEERHGDTPLRFGGWHGDLTPWNLSRRGGGVHIWDWERASACVPFGFDAAHFEFQRTARYSSVDVAGAMASSRGRLGPRLRALDLDPGSDDALWLLYGLEILLRYEEARAEGALARPSTIHAGILALFAGSLAE